MGVVPTPETGELRLTATIPFIHKATTATGAAGVPWVRKDHRNAQAFGFVRDKRSQLAEAPTALLVALAFVNRHPAADVGQVFQHQCGFRVFGIRNKTSNSRSYGLLIAFEKKIDIRSAHEESGLKAAGL